MVHFRSDLLVCGVTNGCHTVQNSTYATLVGIPIAILGIAMYVLLFGLGALRLRHPEHRESASYVAFAIALTGLLYASYLTYVELFVIDAICQWCVASAFLTLGLCLIESRQVWRTLEITPVEAE